MEGIKDILASRNSQIARQQAAWQQACDDDDEDEDEDEDDDDEDDELYGDVLGVSFDFPTDDLRLGKHERMVYDADLFDLPFSTGIGCSIMGEHHNFTFSKARLVWSRLLAAMKISNCHCL
jgi:hypothetical protein